MTRYIFPLVVGLGGVAILLSLGIWQVQRLAWKEGILAEINRQISAPAVALFHQPLEEFVSVQAQGLITDEEIHVLTSRKPDGAGFRVVSAFETEGRRVLLDRGFVAETEKAKSRPAVDAKITGNFRTVQESDSFTPDPDLGKNIWFARDVPAMAKTLNTEPILIILRETSEVDPPVRPWPVDTNGIPNNHMQYAITWFLLAMVWAGMTAFLLWRIRQRTA